MTLRNISHMQNITNWRGRLKKRKLLENLKNLVPKHFLCSHYENEYPQFMFSFTNKKVISVWIFKWNAVSGMEKTEVIQKSYSFTCENIRYKFFFHMWKYKLLKNTYYWYMYIIKKVVSLSVIELLSKYSKLFLTCQKVLSKCKLRVFLGRLWLQLKYCFRLCHLLQRIDGSLSKGCHIDIIQLNL